ncbi:hypothetical protein CASFOL_006868 [Castilleja foliolosa]|uniref:DUF4378 domain-containing protein n=1 Tax=Castilleja foliolosa TaxID=1961234 RepID=A0ABD3E7L6_9LAMI
MVREWLQWVVGGGGRPSRRRSFPATKNGGINSSSGGGCMCAVFHQLFDLQNMHSFGTNYQPDPTHFLPEDQPATTSKGVEAPRNSLELDEPLPIKEKEDNSNLPVGINKIKTRVASKSRTEENNNNNNYSSDCSPGTSKTPNLVARLMGLDLLPESNNNSPSLSTSNSKAQIKNPKTKFSDDDIVVGLRSSSTVRRSDFEYHRLSLQINKENKNVDEFAISAKMRGKSAKSENSSPAGHFAKQVVNQVKEKTNRRGFGLTDITNRDRDEFSRRDQNLVLVKKLDPKKKIVTNSGTKSPRNSASSCEGNNDQLKQGVFKDGRRIGGGNGNISSGLKKLQLGPQSCDYSVRDPKNVKNKAKLRDEKKGSKKLGPLISGEIVNVSGPTTVLPVKKDPSNRATKLPQKQSQVSDALSSKRSIQLSRNPSRSYKQMSLRSDQISTVLPDNDNGSTSAAAAYKDYVGKILKRAGIKNDKITPLTKWRTPSHPLDPSIFYYLELFYPGAAAHSGELSRRSNRKLIFQLVNELLADILKPHLDFKPWVESNGDGFDQLSLCDELCQKIGDFPAADCKVLEDIDSLIDRDLCKSKLNGGFEGEREELVCEIEGEIMECLVRETVAAVVGGGRRTEEKRKKKTESRPVPRAGALCHVR